MYYQLIIINDCLNRQPDPTLANPYQKPKRQCILCKYNIEVDYKVRHLSID